MRHTWESVVLSDESLRRDALLVTKALARLADAECEVRVTMRSLGDAMLGTRFDPLINVTDEWERGSDNTRALTMAASRGLASLTRRGYVVRLNPGAPRREAGHYLLTIPARRLADAA